MDKIKVKLEGSQHSQGRGVGFYHRFLKEELSRFFQIDLVTDSPDVTHFTFFDLFYPTLPLKKITPTIVTVHDLTPLVLHSLYPTGLRGKLAQIRQTFSLNSASAIVTDSINSQNDIHRLLKLPLDRIYPIPLAVDPIYKKEMSADFISDIKRKYNLPSRFVLYVGGINVNKNLFRLATACVSLKIPLVLVSSEFTKRTKQPFSIKKLLGLQKVHPELVEFQRLKEYIQANSEIKVLSAVETNQDLAAIYRLATVYCLPSLYEGFGLTILEAMTCGCPITCSNTGSLPEIYPAGTITFSPDSDSEIRTALEKVLGLKETDKQKLIKQAQKRALDFSWEKTTAATIGVYKKVKSKNV